MSHNSWERSQTLWYNIGHLHFILDVGKVILDAGKHCVSSRTASKIIGFSLSSIPSEKDFNIWNRITKCTTVYFLILFYYFFLIPSSIFHPGYAKKMHSITWNKRHTVIYMIRMCAMAIKSGNLSDFFLILVAIPIFWNVFVWMKSQTNQKTEQQNTFTNQSHKYNEMKCTEHKIRFYFSTIHSHFVPNADDCDNRTRKK